MLRTEQRLNLSDGLRRAIEHPRHTLAGMAHSRSSESQAHNGFHVQRNDVCQFGFATVALDRFWEFRPFTCSSIRLTLFLTTAVFSLAHENAFSGWFNDAQRWF